MKVILQLDSSASVHPDTLKYLKSLYEKNSPTNLKMNNVFKLVLETKGKCTTVSLRNLLVAPFSLSPNQEAGWVKVGDTAKALNSIISRHLNELEKLGILAKNDASIPHVFQLQNTPKARQAIVDNMPELLDSYLKVIDEISNVQAMLNSEQISTPNSSLNITDIRSALKVIESQASLVHSLKNDLLKKDCELAASEVLKAEEIKKLKDTHQSVLTLLTNTHNDKAIELNYAERKLARQSELLETLTKTTHPSFEKIILEKCTEIDTLTTTLATHQEKLSSTIKTLNTKDAELHSANTEIAKQTTLIAQLESSIQEVQSLLEEKISKIEMLEKKHEEEKIKAQQLQTKLEKITTKLDEKNSEKKEANARIKQLEAGLLTYKSLSEKLSSENEQILAENTEYKKLLQQYHEQHDLDKNSLNLYGEMLDTKTQSLYSAKKTIGDQTAQIKALQDQLAATKSELEQKEKTQDNYKKNLEVTSHSLHSAKKTIDSQRAQIKALQEQLAATTSTLSQNQLYYQKKLDATSQALHSAQTSIANQAAQISTLQHRLTSTEDELAQEKETQFDSAATKLLTFKQNDRGFFPPASKGTKRPNPVTPKGKTGAKSSKKAKKI